MASTMNVRYDIDDNLKTFRDRLRELIEGHGYQLIDIAFNTGISSSALSRYLSAQRLPDMKYVLVLCRFFGVSADWLLGISETTPKNETPELVRLYNCASQDDKAVVDAVLKKYKK